MPEGGFRHLYHGGGPQGYYREHADDYHNPHESVVVACIEHVLNHWVSTVFPQGIDLSHVLDLAAGGGEATLAILRYKPEAQILGIDPYTARLYERRTRLACREYTFEQIAREEVTLPSASCVVVSCALHLVGDSWLPGLCLELARVAKDLLVLSPLTRPQLKEQWGWRSTAAETITVEERTLRLRWYRSLLVESNSSSEM